MSHNYNLKLVWTGNKGEGTSTYRSYDRSYTISIDNKEDIHGTSDPAFRGDKTKHNPEEIAGDGVVFVSLVIISAFVCDQ